MRVGWWMAILAGCSGGGEDPTDTGSPTDTDTGRPVTNPGVPVTYDFPGRDGSESSVSYGGQVFRHLLIGDQKRWIDGLTARIDTGAWFPVPGEVEAGLSFYFDFDSETGGSLDHGLSTDPAPKQRTYDEVSTDKDLVGKIAGNDAAGQHRDWAVEGIGWDEPGVDTPESLVRHWFEQLDAAAVARANVGPPVGPDGLPLARVTLTLDGLDHGELIQKFLLGAVAYSQGADDYLDDDLPGSGLLSSHVAVDGAYTDLEHAWDEGFGYFGAARDFGAWSDDLVAAPSVSDTWAPDGAIDLLGEVSYGHATNAAKRDLGAPVATDLTGEAWAGFLEGRALLASIDGELTPEQLDALRGHRDRALAAWELAIVATAIHYVNDVLQDMGKFGTPEYVYADHAKHWSELKGFALSLQFNPHGCALAEMEAVHQRLGTRPVLPAATPAEIAAYRQALVEVKERLGAACDVDPGNLGDENGLGGW